jgi:hypothetical protein
MYGLEPGFSDPVRYSGTVAAGLIARKSGFRKGQHIRVLPFGDVAHDEAANPEGRPDLLE